MVDRERLLAKLEEIDAYARELQTVAPASIDNYREPRTKRACERLLQIAIEAVIDVCGVLVKGFRLGLPAEEDDLFEKLAAGGVISVPMAGTLQRMRRFRNILVHEYVRGRRPGFRRHPAPARRLRGLQTRGARLPADRRVKIFERRYRPARGWRNSSPGVSGLRIQKPEIRSQKPTEAPSRNGTRGG